MFTIREPSSARYALASLAGVVSGSTVTYYYHLLWNRPPLNRQSRNVTSCLMPEFNDASRFRHILSFLTPLRDSQPRIPSRSMQRHSILFWKLNSESKILNDGRFGKVVDGEFAWWDFAWLGVEILLDRSISSKQKMSSTPLLFSLFQPFFFGLGFLVWYDSLYY